MKILTLVIAVTTPSVVAAEPPIFDMNQIHANCSAEWGTDFQMAAYCLDQQKEGFRIFTGMLRIYDDIIELIGPSFDYCRGEWEPDWNMVKYCAMQQVEAVPRISAAVKNLPETTGVLIMHNCSVEWKPDYTMIAYCSEQQAEGWHRLND